MNKPHFCERKYHFYIDEGGMFGTCHVLISDSPLRKKANEEDISNYYFGKCTFISIERHIYLWRQVFPREEIKLTIKSKYFTDKDFKWKNYTSNSY